ncbi:sporulation protein YlmC with PRC-barrel domain [Mycobacterium sp. MAA66]|uniref:PRC-barrel domain-containing protein n=1 Tax=Mycobacterium sp. MAA66 TaxID=3156297 RepID=UPI003513CF14
MIRAGRQRGNRRLISARLTEQIATRRAIAGQVVSIAQLLGRPVRDEAGTRVGRVSDVVVRWDGGAAHPMVTGILVRAGAGRVLLECGDVTLRQHEVCLVSNAQRISRPVRQSGDVELASDILDHQLVDIAGVQVVRAADVYVLNGPAGWELAGVDVGLVAFFRRLLPRGRSCPSPDRVIDWAELQAFMPRYAAPAANGSEGPADAAGQIGGSVQFSRPAAELTKLRGSDVASILAGLGRRQQAQVAAQVEPSAAVAALRELQPAQRDALLAELNVADRSRLTALLDGEAS